MLFVSYTIRSWEVDEVGKRADLGFQAATTCPSNSELRGALEAARSAVESFAAEAFDDDWSVSISAESAVFTIRRKINRFRLRSGGG